MNAAYTFRYYAFEILFRYVWTIFWLLKNQGLKIYTLGVQEKEEEMNPNTSESNKLKNGEHVAAFWLQDDGTYSWYLGNYGFSYLNNEYFQFSTYLFLNLHYNSKILNKIVLLSRCCL